MYASAKSPGNKRETARTDRASARSTDLSPQQNDSSDDRDIRVRHRRLCANLRSCGSESASDTLKNLGPHDLSVGGVFATRVDHEADTTVIIVRLVEIRRDRTRSAYTRRMQRPMKSSHL